MLGNYSRLILTLCLSTTAHVLKDQLIFQPQSAACYLNEREASGDWALRHGDVITICEGKIGPRTQGVSRAKVRRFSGCKLNDRASAWNLRG